MIGKFLKIRKRSGGIRLIFCPSKKERLRLRSILKDSLNDKQNTLKYAHGFIKQKNIITNAEPHINKKMTVSLDIENFFNTVTLDKVGQKLSKEIKDNCFVDGIAYQGLPTSPAIANIIFNECDLKIVELLDKEFSQQIINKEFTSNKRDYYTYTRYADDISISFDDVIEKDILKTLLNKISIIIGRHGFKVNKKKTKIQLSKNGKREICGVYVDDEKVSVNRKAKRKLRALKHKLKYDSDNIELKQKYDGYLEFCNLKKPTQKTVLKECEKITKYYKLTPITKISRKLIEEQFIAPNIKITNDPLYFIGMSSFTNGWTSCMALNARNKYDHRFGVNFWYDHPGVSIAIHLSDKDRTVGGVKRKRMISRCLLYKLENGETVYGRIYPGSNNELREALESVGFKSRSNYSRVPVEGDLLGNYKKPYLDDTFLQTYRQNNGDVLYKITIN